MGRIFALLNKMDFRDSNEWSKARLEFIIWIYKFEKWVFDEKNTKINKKKGIFDLNNFTIQSLFQLKIQIKLHGWKVSYIPSRIWNSDVSAIMWHFNTFYDLDANFFSPNPPLNNVCPCMHELPRVHNVGLELVLVIIPVITNLNWHFQL